MTAADILKLIETVDPSDTAKLDEIDARVWCYLNGHWFVGKMRKAAEDKTSFTYIKKGTDATHWNTVSKTENLYCAKHYTRSRDALKAIRPEGWTFEIIKHSNEMFSARYGDIINSNTQPTEELAELHAIIQAIEYERTKS